MGDIHLLRLGVVDEKSGQLRLGHNGQLGVCTSDIAFPVRVLRRVGGWGETLQTDQSHLQGRDSVTHLWLQGWSTSPASSQEAGSGGLQQLEDHSKSQGSRRQHPLRGGGNVSMTMATKRANVRNFFQKPLGLRW